MFINYLFCNLALSSYFSRDYSFRFGFEVLRELSLLVEVNRSFRVLLDELLVWRLAMRFALTSSSSYFLLLELFLLLVTSRPYLFFLVGSTEFSFYLVARLCSR